MTLRPMVKADIRAKLKAAGPAGEAAVLRRARSHGHVALPLSRLLPDSLRESRDLYFCSDSATEPYKHVGPARVRAHGPASDVHQGEKDAELARTLGQLQPLSSCIPTGMQGPTGVSFGPT